MRTGLRWMTAIVLLGSAFGRGGTVQSDEGMWLLNNPPRQQLKSKYGFDLGAAWLERAQKASVRFNNGGSGGFVSPDGLVVTNHHIAADALQKLGSKEHDYYHDGFLAATRADELKCPDLELNVLMAIEDVTDRVNASVKPEMTSAQAFAARRAAMAGIEKESLDKTGLRSDVVTLYHGGQYHLYRYKKYTDVRLVFAPESTIAAFGGDVDNFEFPRYCLDVAFFRAYEDGQPAKTPHYFKWNEKGPAEGDLVFVSGHPGTTQRLETLAKLTHRRDHTLPYTLARLRAMEAATEQYAARGPEQARMAAKDGHRYANARKAFSGQYQGLLDPAILAVKARQEKELRDAIAADPAKQKEYGSAWDRVAEAMKAFADFEVLYYLLERGDAFDSELFGIARHLLRLSEEKGKPSAERLREYRDSNLESLEFQLYSPAPIYPEFERVKLTASLTFLAEKLGGAHPLVVRILDGKNPAARAEELTSGTKLADVAERKRLSTADAVTASSDPMIRLARLVDAEARAVRKRYEEQVEEVERQANSLISRARFDLHGAGIAPDATFTLRLAFGTVKGYRVDGEDLPFHTTFGGAFEKADRLRHREPFVLPKRWLDGKDRLDLTTPFDFASTADTIGGNSGSPVLNRDGELVGINFDRNRHGLVRNFVYTDEQARHIAVHCRAVLEALRRLYGAEALAKELLGGT